ncbi:DUF1707 domain-containing protein [Nocardiopsis sp. N85]|uniref:DUF1707 SHOCT-like domain-containing protein n=1 Tax=Nocardiopsis sp. N85 TaxID=3029400 RepID=UPI00237F0193|nr:DUF1707 domain-containing protein [Nocardiopsis sp. N85]MDE3722631.1 DUF1707 domain-containing protein [Nocardiopsis sp. N85]
MENRHRARASDIEREHTVERLTSAYVEGRIDLDEYERRVGSALRAVLVGELDDLTADLPAPSPTPPRAAPVSESRWDHADEWRWWLGIAVLLTGVWAAVSLANGALVPYWPLVPLGIWAAVLLASIIWPEGGEPL